MGKAMFGPRGESINGIDGYYNTSVDFAGGSWGLEVGYRIVSTGTSRSQRMTKDGLEVDMGEAPTVKIVTIEFSNSKDKLFLPMWLLSADQEVQLESEITDHLQELWA